MKRLFEQEVPEIYDSTVEIKACAREAGERTKIAVLSRDRDVDAVGACVGMRGMRVQTIIRELRGEKIDIVPYIEDPVEMVLSALSPAKIIRVNVIDPEDKHMEVIVDESQLSLAIGKKGQNVRLAAKLLGWRIDIKSEDEKRKEVEEAMAAISGGGTPVGMLLEYGLSEGPDRPAGGIGNGDRRSPGRHDARATDGDPQRGTRTDRADSNRGQSMLRAPPRERWARCRQQKPARPSRQRRLERAERLRRRPRKPRPCCPASLTPARPRRKTKKTSNSTRRNSKALVE